MSKVITIVYTQLEFTFKSMKRYWLNSVSIIIELSLLLVFLFFGVESFATYNLSSEVILIKKTQYAIGMFVYVIVFNIFFNLANLVTESKNSGKLEQIIVNPYGSAFLLLVESLGNIIFLMLLSSAGIGIVMLIYKIKLYSNILMIFPLIIPPILTTLGISFIFAGITFIFKKANNFISVMQYVTLALMILPSYPFSLWSLLPIGVDSTVINKYFSGAITYIGYKWWIYLYIHGAVYFIIGVFIYKLCEDYAKEKGILGHL